MPPVVNIPLARDNLPWAACGDIRGPDFGAVFAWTLSPSATALTYDRAGRLHALTLLRGQSVGAEIVLQGRRFQVRAGDPARRPL
ncbi:MAG TPA: hypothetical protein VGL58_06335 [Caulobacteraceae bacterium]|jgi:YD repeat-containing protein